MTQPSPTSPVAIAVQEDPLVRAAMRRIADGAEELQRAVDALGATTPRLSGALPGLVPVLVTLAVRRGRDRA